VRSEHLDPRAALVWIGSYQAIYSINGTKFISCHSHERSFHSQRLWSVKYLAARLRLDGSLNHICYFNILYLRFHFRLLSVHGTASFHRQSSNEANGNSALRIGPSVVYWNMDFNWTALYNTHIKQLTILIINSDFSENWLARGSFVMYLLRWSGGYK